MSKAAAMPSEAFKASTDAQAARPIKDAHSNHLRFDLTNGADTTTGTKTKSCKEDTQRSEFGSTLYNGTALYAMQSIPSTSRLPITRDLESLRSHAHHTKRRKINTCIPCKRRKVKCDREKPYCGQCQKSQIPAEECTWSVAPEDSPALVRHQADPNDGSAASHRQVQSPWPHSHGEDGGQALPPTIENNQAILLERIATLETELAAAQSTISSFTLLQSKQESVEVHTIQGRQAAAFDEQPMGQECTHLHLSYPRLFERGNEARPIASASDSTSEILLRDAVNALPGIKIIGGLLQLLDTVQGHGMSLGIIPQSILEQAERMTNVSADNGLLALVFSAVAVGASLAPLDLLHGLGVVESEDDIKGVIFHWTSMAQDALQTAARQEQSDANVVGALLLQRHLHLLKGQVLAASVSLSIAAKHAIALNLGAGANEAHGDSQIESVETKQVDCDGNESHRNGSDVTFLASYVSASRIGRPNLSPHVPGEAGFGQQAWLYIAELHLMEDPFRSEEATHSVGCDRPVLARKEVKALPGFKEDLGIQMCQRLCQLARLTSHIKGNAHASHIYVDVISDIKSVPGPDLLSEAIDAGSEIEIGRRQIVGFVWDLYRQYAIFTAARMDETQPEVCIEAARLVVENRLNLLNFPGHVHRFFSLQSFALQCALMLVVYLHQYSTQITDERKQVLQTAINDLYAQPGFEHASALLSLSVDSREYVDEAHQLATSSQDSNATEDEASVHPFTGMTTKRGKLAPFHPLVVGLRGFLLGHLSPFGTGDAVLKFWTSLERNAALFLLTM